MPQVPTEHNPLLPMASFDPVVDGDARLYWEEYTSEWSHGDWVRYEDALVEIAALRALLEDAIAWISEMTIAINKVQDWDGTRVGSCLESADTRLAALKAKRG